VSARRSGKLDALLSKMPGTQKVACLASRLGVSRKTILRWQDGESVSRFNQLRVNMLCSEEGIRPVF
jgi:predicted transcriptional regulator